MSTPRSESTVYRALDKVYLHCMRVVPKVSRAFVAVCQVLSGLVY